MRDFINVQLLYYFDLFYIRTRRKLLLVLDFRLSEIYENERAKVSKKSNKAVAVLDHREG